MKHKLIAGLDIGSTAVRLVLGQLIATENGEKLQVVGAVSGPANGVSKGVITSIEDATSSISACLEKAERLLGVSVSEVYIGINGPNLKCERSKGVVGVSRSDSEINNEDVVRVNQAAEALTVPQHYSILHVVPLMYKVDNQEFIKNPIGMTGIRLEAEVLIVQSLSSQIKNLTRSIERAGLAINDLVFSPLAAATVVVDSTQKELGVAVVNLGSSTTSVAVFEEGEVLHTAVLPIGSAHITNDIAIGLRCSLVLAEKIKVRYGSAKAENFNKKDEIDISDLLAEENLNEDNSAISRHYVAEIIQARVEEILEKVDAELKKIQRSGMLPAGVVLIGCGAKLGDLVEIAKKCLRLPVSLGGNRQVPTVNDKVNDLEYLTALGLVAWGEQQQRMVGPGTFLPGNIGGWLKKIVGWIKP